MYIRSDVAFRGQTGLAMLDLSFVNPDPIQTSVQSSIKVFLACLIGQIGIDKLRGTSRRMCYCRLCSQFPMRAIDFHLMSFGMPSGSISGSP
jgi:hypothetical protein